MLNKVRTVVQRHGIIGAAVAAMRRAYAIAPGQHADDRFRGAFPSYDDAISAIPPGLLVGYNNEQAVGLDFEKMSKIQPSDRQVIAWLERLLPEVNCLLDAGGHMGTKYRAFREHLHLDYRRVKWIVYETPVMVQAGRERAAADGLDALSFIESLNEVPAVDLLLCSGLLQYLDIPFADLVGHLRQRPRHIVLNKVATRDGPTVVMLERMGMAEVPYQIRCRLEFVSSVEALGYEIVDEWVLPEFAHVIKADPSLGMSTSRGYYARLRQA